MKQLLYKELKLSTHPTTYLFLLFGAMLLIPAYPYYVAFMYMCLAVFFVFLTGRENKDVFFTALLPVAKGDAVRARCLLVALMELAQLAVAVPFALLRAKLMPGMPNTTGMEANVALFGLTLVMFGGFNLIFLPTFYRTGYSAGRALLFGGTFVLLYIVLAEATTYFVPCMMALDTADPGKQAGQLPVLLIGAAVFALATYFACRLSVRRFEKVDL